MKVSIYRFDPDADEKAHLQDVEVELPEGRDLMVLDVLELAKSRDPSIAYRRSCREGRVRLRRHEHQRQERPRLHHAGLRGRAGGGKLVLRPLAWACR